METPEQCVESFHSSDSGVLIVNFEQISPIAFVSLLLNVISKNTQ